MQLAPTFYVGTPTALGSYRVRASLAGQNATSSVVSVVQPELRFSKTQLNVGRSFQTSGFPPELVLERVVSGVPIVLNESLSVTLSISDPSKVGTQPLVTIPAGGSSVSVSAIRGIEFTAGTPVLVDATAAGYSSPTNKLQVSVVNGVIRFCDLLTSREIGAERDEATVCAGVQSGSTHPEVPSVNWLLSLSLSNPTPPGIVAGLFNQEVGGSPITQLFWGANSTSSSPFFVGLTDERTEPIKFPRP